MGSALIESIRWLEYVYMYACVYAYEIIAMATEWILVVEGA